MRLQLLKSSVLVFAALVTFDAEASAGIIAVTGDIEIVSPPSSVRRQVYESSSAIRVFLERELQINSFPENAVAPGVYNAYSDFVDATFNPSGPVRSYLIHFDPVGQSLAQLSGSISFAEPILAVIGRSLTLEQTDGTLGSPSTLYPTDRFNRELEYQTRGNYDFFRLEPDGRTIFTQLECSTDVDQIRVVTAVPEPASLELAVIVGALLVWSIFSPRLPNPRLPNYNSCSSTK